MYNLEILFQTLTVVIHYFINTFQEMQELKKLCHTVMLNPKKKDLLYSDICSALGKLLWLLCIPDLRGGI